MFGYSSAKAYLCNQGSTASPFFRLACQILNLADMHGITLIPTYIHTHLHVEADCHGEGWFQSAMFFLIAEAKFHLWDQLEVNFLSSLYINECKCYYNLENQLPLGNWSRTFSTILRHFM